MKINQNILVTVVYLKIKSLLNDFSSYKRYTWRRAAVRVILLFLLKTLACMCEVVE